MPIPSWLVFLRTIFYQAISAAVLGIFILPVGKLVLWNIFDIQAISFTKYLIIFVLSSCFYGAFGLLMASFVKNMLKIGSVWMRLIYPLWFLGCFQFSWHALYNASPVLAYLNLLNPITYITEGFRSALLARAELLNFWFCVGMLIVGTIIATIVSIDRLKKRLDLI